MYTEQEILSRTNLLLGDEVMKHLAETRVILFGVGGVGSWCAESLVRSGIKHLTIVDSDTVNVTNINRQLMATTETVGQPKVEVLKARLLAINPNAEIEALQEIYSIDNDASFALNGYDYIIDAIDSLEHKANLIRSATKTDAVFFSSMGAALKLDSSRIQTAEFWKVKGCPLAAALRRKMRKGEMPSKKFFCVYSDEVLENKGTYTPPVTAGQWDELKAQINGTVAHITAIFGFRLAALVLQDLYDKTYNSAE